MRKSTLVLATVLAALALAAALFLICGTLRAEVTVTAASAADYPAIWSEIERAMAADAVAQAFSEPLPQDPAACRLEDVTITFFNPGLIPAEWVSVSTSGAPGDVAVYSVANEGADVPGRGTASVSLKMIARADGTGERAYRAQYYVFGLKRSITVKAGQ